MPGAAVSLKRLPVESPWLQFTIDPHSASISSRFGQVPRLAAGRRVRRGAGGERRGVRPLRPHGLAAAAAAAAGRGSGDQWLGALVMTSTDDEMRRNVVESQPRLRLSRYYYKRRLRLVVVQVIRGWELGLRTMRYGEQALLRCR
jgi:hypothetical protein